MTGMEPDQLFAAIPLAAHLGMELVSASEDEVVGRIAVRPELTTVGGSINGGTTMALADNVGAMCAFLHLPDGASTSTISSSTVFTRGVRSGYLTATARPIHVGRSTISVLTELRDDDGKLVAQVTQTQAVLTPRA